MTEYKISTPEDVNPKAWQEFVENHEYGSVFHTPFFYKALSQTRLYRPFAYFVVGNDRCIQALLAGYTQTVRSSAPRFLTTRAVIPSSPIFLVHNAFDMLLNSVAKRLPGKPIYTEIHNSYISDALRTGYGNAGYIWEGHYNIIRELPEDPGELWRQIDRKRKDGINKAKRFDFRFVEDHSETSINNFYSLLQEIYRRIKLPIPELDLFVNCCETEDSRYCRIFNLLDDGNTKISLFSFLYKETLYAYYIGTSGESEFIQKRPVDLFYFEVMKWCIENKIRFFDWMGAGKPNVPYGVRDFKLQYGGDLIDLGRFTRINSPLRFQLAKTGLKLMQKYGRIN